MNDELKDIKDPRLAQILDVIARFAAGDLTARGTLSYDESALDSVMAGINILGEKMQASVAENKRALEFANTLISSSPDGVLAVDLNLRITEWSQLMEQMCGKGRAQVIGQSLAEIPFMQKTGEAAWIRDGLEGKNIGPREVAYRIPGEDKERFFESLMAPLQGDAGQIVGGVLRNPLGVMSKAVYFLQTVLADADETPREYLGILNDEIANADRIVGDLLDSVRTKPPQTEAVEVKALIEQTLRKCEIPASVTVTQAIPETLSSLLVDAQQIQQVLRNLISNAMEAMPTGGTLEISAVENKKKGTITIGVRDSGVGITPEGMARLFQPLFTTKTGGIGLGLMVVKNLTEANGGTVAVQSEVGQGTTFSVILPTRPSPAGED